MQIQPVQKRARDVGKIPLNTVGRTSAGMSWMSKKTAGTGIHGGNQHNVAGISSRASHSGDGHGAVFNRLPQDLHSAAAEFRELVKKQNAIMSQGEFAGSGRGPAACQACSGDSVMRRAKGTLPDQGNTAGHKPCYRVNFCGFNGF